MNRHPYIRAYMAGVLLPTWFLLVVLTGYVFGHIAQVLPGGVERAIVFPMAVVPNLWGLWNVLYLALGPKNRIPVGAFGALLPLVLVPAGLALASILDLRFYSVTRAVMALPIVMCVYFLVWKYGVGSLNRLVNLP
jgi:hypothetical protein